MTELGVEETATSDGFVGLGYGMVRTRGLTIASFEIVAHGRVGCLVHPSSFTFAPSAISPRNSKGGSEETGGGAISST